jgi:CrcB protein
LAASAVKFGSSSGQGYTTFSSFSLQTLNLMNDGEWIYAAANTFGSILLCFLAVWTGHAIAANIGELKVT